MSSGGKSSRPGTRTTPRSINFSDPHQKFANRRDITYAQAARFKERLANPKKNWKFSHADLTTRQHWDDYIEAYEDMLNKTSHPDARWHVVPADRNWYRDHVIAETVARAVDGLKLKWPKPTEDLSKIRIK